MQEPMIRTLSRKFVDKVWGVECLPAPFPHPSHERIGEVWFEPPAELDELLVKYIFTSERLSVQSHPNDAQAAEMGLGRTGKNECWVILEAEPDATIAVGFDRALDADELRKAALDGSIVDLLTWHPVEKGDAFYIPAGTVHAIGAGVSLIEVQQNSDITFRLYDYGRPRELHLEQGMAVSHGEPYPASLRSKIDGPGGVLAQSSHFSLYFRDCKTTGFEADLTGGPALLIPFDAPISVGEQTLAPGECALVPAYSSDRIRGDGILLIAQAAG